MADEQGHYRACQRRVYGDREGPSHGCDRLRSTRRKAFAAEDAQVVKPKATNTIVGQLERRFSANAAKGEHERRTLNGITVPPPPQPSDGKAEVDAIRDVDDHGHRCAAGSVIRRVAFRVDVHDHALRDDQGNAWLLDNTRSFA